MESTNIPRIRGIFSELDSEDWLSSGVNFSLNDKHSDFDLNLDWSSSVKDFPNKVPRFKTKSECLLFTEKFMDTKSNPDDPSLRHSITTLTDWNQIEKYLLPAIKYHRNKPTQLPDSEILNDNIFFCKSDIEKDGILPSKVHDYLVSRLDLPIHSLTTEMSVSNTFNYLFQSMRCGIYVMIKDNQLEIFCPFVNKNYKNNWGDKLQLSGSSSVEEYYRNKNSGENYISDKSKWWTNGNIICSQYVSLEDELKIGNQWWGDHFLFQLKDMLAETCRSRDVPDCEFFVNKRDYPQIKFNKQLGVVEPYGFIYDKDDKDESQDIPLQENNYKSYAPVLSFYSSDRFADIPFPPSEDWEAATGEVFPSSFIPEYNNGVKTPKTPRDLFTSENLKKFEFPWSDKLPTAFFRGTATGGGVTTETNQRLHVASISHEWSKTQLSDQLPPYLDAKLTGWNFRDKKIYNTKTSYINKKDFPFNVGRSNFTPIYEQSKFKYLLYIEGHCAACRYGFMMRLGSVILKTESKCVADKMWYFPLLRPYYDHVPIKADFSDLKEKIEWCRTHDSECQIIASNALKVYEKFISREGILDYMQLICYEISSRYFRLPEWARNPPVSYLAPKKNGNDTIAVSCCSKGFCNICSMVKEFDEENSKNDLLQNVVVEKTKQNKRKLEEALYKQKMRDRANKKNKV